MSSGEEKGWELLSELSHESVCRNSCAAFDKQRELYVLRSFGFDIDIVPDKKEISSDSPCSDVLLGGLGEHARFSLLWYLANAKDIPLSGRLVRPDNIRGGHLFTKGTHLLPMDRLAREYSADIEGFISKGRMLGAEVLEYGDASLRLFPVPRVPVVLILWKGDGEFPARADFLFDSTAEFQAPTDVLWAIAMMSVLIMS